MIFQLITLIILEYCLKACYTIYVNIISEFAVSQ